MPENRFANIESADDNNINTIPTTTQTINTDLAIFLKFTVFFLQINVHLQLLCLISIHLAILPQYQ